MRYPENSTAGALAPEDVLSFVERELGELFDPFDSEFGIYSALGDLAIQLRERISARSIDASALRSVAKVFNELGASDNSEVQNLLVVGVLEILTDRPEVVYAMRQCLSGNAAVLFEKTLAE